jgi:MoxR-like ATPase
MMDISEIKPLADSVREEIAKAIIGQVDTVDLLLTALFSGGHMLLEGVPGTAKTFLAQTFATAVDLDFGRIQFTPDLMPGDVIGTNIFSFQDNKFNLVKGPIFCDLLLADEINRTPPKTQAALLEAMQERQVSIDGETLKLGDHFMVVATQNPIEQQGTYPLPEAQLDRFLFKHILDYPTEEEELEIVRRHGAKTGNAAPKTMGVKKVLPAKTLKAALAAVSEVRLSEDILAYIVRLVRSTRDNPLFETGASPRAAAMISAAARARAALEGRDFCVPDDVKMIALPALRHRAILSPAAEIEGRSADDVLLSIIEQTEAPR